MSSEPSCKTPIVFVIFNRPELTRRVFARIAEARPPRLLIIADGPRADRRGEAQLCAQVREIATQVDWPCNVQTNFAATNMGCRKRLVSGLDWVFQEVERAIILEDDVLPDISFFRFCDEMLDRFANDSRISMIGGFNTVSDRMQTSDSYYFSRLTHIWGWASWRRSWARYDEHLVHWPAIKAAGLLQSFFESAQYRFWTRIFDGMHDGTGTNTWDYQWVYSNLINNALSITPRVNLVENIGFGPEATHTLTANDALKITAGSLSFPLQHPIAVIPSATLDTLDGRRSGTWTRSFGSRVFSKIRRTVLASLRKR